MLVTHKVKILWLALSQKDTCCELASNKGTIVKTPKVFFWIASKHYEYAFLGAFPPSF